MNKVINAKLKKNAIPFEKVVKRYDRKKPGSERTIKAKAKYYETLMDIRKTRKKLGYTLEQLEALSGIPKATISRIETGKRNTRIMTLMSLAESMGKTLEVRLK